MLLCPGIQRCIVEIQIDMSQDPCKVAVGRTEVSLDLRGILYSPGISQAVQQGWSAIPGKNVQ